MQRARVAEVHGPVVHGPVVAAGRLDQALVVPAFVAPAIGPPDIADTRGVPQCLLGICTDLLPTCGGAAITVTDLLVLK